MFLKIGDSWVNPAQIAHLRLFEGITPRLSVVTCDGAGHTELGERAGKLFEQILSRTTHFVQTSACATSPKLIHLAVRPFEAICGADVPNQSTSTIVAHVNCEACLAKRLEDAAVAAPPPAAPVPKPKKPRR